MSSRDRDEYEQMKGLIVTIVQKASAGESEETGISKSDLLKAIRQEMRLVLFNLNHSLMKMDLNEH